MNKIVMGDYTFTDDNIAGNPNIVKTNAMLSDSLEVDTFEFSVYSDATGPKYIITANGETFATSADEPYIADEGYLINTPYATPVYLYKNNTLRGKFYLKSIQRVGLTLFQVQCVSAIGLLEGARTVGGIYTGETAQTVINSLMADAGFSDYTIANDVKNLSCFGWIPYGSVRDALAQVLFAFGASIVKKANGGLEIRFISEASATVLPDSSVYLGGSIDNPQTVTDVTLYEHSFVEAADNVEDVLFDNSLAVAADHLMMYFSDPYHSLRTTGTLVINASGANYATVTGVGLLYGKKYTHTQRVLTQHINTDREKNEVVVDNATLVSTSNSSNCLKRLANYYTNAIPMEVSVVNSRGLRPTDYVTLTDPFGETVEGYIQKMDETVSAIDKAKTKLVTNWTPSNLGNSYDSYLIVTGSNLSNGTWTVPSALRGKEALIVLFSGAQGGQGGYAGRTPKLTSGYTGKYVDEYGYVTLTICGRSAIQQGGAGGTGGAGGASATRILNINIPSLANSYLVSFGAGGTGGAGGTVNYIMGGGDRPWRGDWVETLPAEGADGEDSIFGEYTTADGTVFKGTYINLITGAIVAKSGSTGGTGGKGGDGGTGLQIADSTTDDYTYTTEGKGSKGANVGTWTGGAGANGNRGIKFTAPSGHKYRGQWVCNGGGGGGGGAAMGSNGGNGSTPTSARYHYSVYDSVGHYTEDYYYYYANYWRNVEFEQDYFYGAIGGDGGNATVIPSQPIYVGGTGGYGGGGGGGAGQSFGIAQDDDTSDETTYCGQTRSGKGGNGGQGGQGSNGFLIVYYHS